MEGEAMILSAIENLERWLLKNKDSSWFVFEAADLRNLVVWLLEFWEENTEKSYRLLAIMVDPFSTEKLLGENVNADLWEDDEGFNKLIDKEKLQSLLRDMAEYAICPCEIELNSVVDVLTVDGRLSKERLYSHMAGIKKILDRIINVATQFPRDGDEETMLWKKVEEVKNELRVMVDLLKSEGLHYFISDVVEMAHYAQFLIRVTDSDASMLYLHMFFDYRKHWTGLPPITRENPLTRLSSKFNSIKKLLQETKEQMQEFGVETTESSQINALAELVAPTYPNGVIGLEKDVESLLHLIVSGYSYYINITGMSGIGKTTLARILYNHPTIVDRYECRAWVCLSSLQISRKELLIKLIRKVVDNSKGFQKNDDYMLLEKMDNRSLRQMLHQQLKGKHHFIVLEDLSKELCFDYVRQVFSKASRSMLVFTSRSVSIFGVHKMKLLDGDKSWQLLLKTTMVGSSDFPRQLEKKGRETLMRKCGGLPLAIKELGMHWAKMRRSGSEWEYILQSSINLDLSATSKALESTYLSLDPETKSCFLHLAFFKEGATIRRDKMEQICTLGLEEYLNVSLSLYKLHRLSIIEFRREKFRLNDIFERLSIKKAEDEIGFEIRMKDGNHRASHEPHHRVVYCGREKFDYRSSQDERHLISLFFYGGSHFDWTIHHFQQLKVLDMDDFGLKILPETVGKLSELRYLGLRNNYIKELPHSLGCLKRLKVLDISLNFMVQVPDIIWEMDSLCHLYMSDIICRKPLKIDALERLKTLTYISVDNWTCEFSGLKLLTHLKKLGIEEFDENSNVSKLFASLMELESLRHLMLRGFRFRCMPSLDELGLLQNLKKLKLEGRLTRLPSADNFPPYIKNLRLINSCLDEDPMPILEKLNNLRYLKLQNAYTGRQMVISPFHLTDLGHLVIKELSHLRNLQVGEGALPYLSDLEISSCPYLEITNLEEILSRYGYLKMVTTQNIASKIRKSDFISRIDVVDITP